MTRLLLFVLLASCADPDIGRLRQAASVPAEAPTTTVGGVPYTHSVDESGNLRVSIPLQLPPGRRGLEPTLSLEYGSDAGGGLLGHGWSLAGLSRIHSCTHRHGLDAQPDVRSHDGYCMDGAPLAWAGSQWRLAPDNHTEIEQLSAEDEWRVHSPDGMTYVFGGAPDARLLDASSEPIAWYLREVSDAWGNSYRVEYERVEGLGAPSGEAATLHRPTRITYTHHDTRDASREIEFDYGATVFEPVTHSYRESTQLFPALLSSIRIHAVRVPVTSTGPALQPELVAHYDLSYLQGGGHPLLDSVTHCAVPSGTTDASDGGLRWTPALPQGRRPGGRGDLG